MLFFDDDVLEELLHEVVVVVFVEAGLDDLVGLDGALEPGLLLDGREQVADDVEGEGPDVELLLDVELELDGVVEARLVRGADVLQCGRQGLAQPLRPLLHAVVAPEEVHDELVDREQRLQRLVQELVLVLVVQPHARRNVEVVRLVEVQRKQPRPALVDLAQQLPRRLVHHHLIFSCIFMINL